MPFPIQIIDDVIKYPRTEKSVPDYIVEMTDPIPFSDLPPKMRENIKEQADMDKDYIDFWLDYRENACFFVNFNKKGKSHSLKINGWAFKIVFALFYSNQCTFAIEVKKANIFTTFYFTTFADEEKPMLKRLLKYIVTISKFKSVQNAKAFHKNSEKSPSFMRGSMKAKAEELYCMFTAIKEESKGKRDEKHIEKLREVYKNECHNFIQNVKRGLDSIEDEIEGNCL